MAYKVKKNILGYESLFMGFLPEQKLNNNTIEVFLNQLPRNRAVLKSTSPGKSILTIEGLSKTKKSGQVNYPDSGGSRGVFLYKNAGKSRVPIYELSINVGKKTIYSSFDPGSTEVLVKRGWTNLGVIGYLNVKPLGKQDNLSYSPLFIKTNILNLDISDIEKFGLLLWEEVKDLAEETWETIKDIFNDLIWGDEKGDVVGPIISVKTPLQDKVTIWVNYFHNKNPNSALARSANLRYRPAFSPNSSWIEKKISLSWTSGFSANSGRYRAWKASFDMLKLDPATRYQGEITIKGKKNADYKASFGFGFDTLPEFLFQQSGTSNLSHPFANVSISGAQRTNNILNLESRVYGGDSNLSKFSNRHVFRIACSSCYDVRGSHSDKIMAAHYGFITNGRSPDAWFWMGDQVYLDDPIQFTLHPDTAHMHRLHVEKYARTWKQLSVILQNHCGFFVSDDHELWNNYPHNPGFIANFDNLRPAWKEIATKTFNDVQSEDRYSTFDIGNDLSFFVVDSRLDRMANGNGFCSTNTFNQLRLWIQNLQSPGVLITGQLLFDKPGSQEKTLVDYTQYNQLCRDLDQVKHDILFITGDVHFGRLAYVNTSSGKRIYEAISSPSSLVGLNYNLGLSAIVASGNSGDSAHSPQNWPSPIISGMNQHPVNYLFNTPNVSKQKLVKRSIHNILTCSFSKTQSAGPVSVNLEYWDLEGLTHVNLESKKAYSKTLKLQ